MLKKVVLHSVATALASRVLPVPGERDTERDRETHKETEREQEGRGDSMIPSRGVVSMLNND